MPNWARRRKAKEDINGKSGQAATSAQDSKACTHLRPSTLKGTACPHCLAEGITARSSARVVIPGAKTEEPKVEAYKGLELVHTPNAFMGWKTCSHLRIRNGLVRFISLNNFPYPVDAKFKCPGHYNRSPYNEYSCEDVDPGQDRCGFYAQKFAEYLIDKDKFVPTGTGPLLSVQLYGTVIEYEEWLRSSNQIVQDVYYKQCLVCLHPPEVFMFHKNAFFELEESWRIKPACKEHAKVVEDEHFYVSIEDLSAMCGATIHTSLPT